MYFESEFDMKKANITVTFDEEKLGAPEFPLKAEEIHTENQDPVFLGARPLEPDDLAIFELYAAEDGSMTFCLDVLAEEPAVFGRQLSYEKEGSYIMPYVVYDEAAGQVCDTMDVELRLPHGEKWFYCKLSPEVRESLKQKMGEFYMERYNEHLPGPAQVQETPAPSQMGPIM